VPTRTRTPTPTPTPTRTADRGPWTADCYRTLKSAFCTSIAAYAGQYTPVGGAPATQLPPDYPGLLVQANMSTLR
jgi:hypothetical protein